MSFVFKKNNSLTKQIIKLLKNNVSIDENIAITIYNELKKNLYCYANNLHKKYNYTLLSNQIINNITDLQFGEINDLQNPNFLSKNIRYEIISDIRKYKINCACFIWFLEDVEGDIIICNDVIKPNIGQIMIIPCSWIFSIKFENDNYNKNSKIIYGYIYNEIIGK